MNCKTCKHWRKSDNNSDEWRDWGECLKADEGYRDTVPLLLISRESVFTHENFGCVMHEEKPDASVQSLPSP